MTGEDVDDAGREAGFFAEGGEFGRLSETVRREIVGKGQERTVSGAFSLDLRTTVQPAARAGATFIVNMRVGAFQGMMAAYDGCKTSTGQLRFSSMCSGSTYDRSNRLPKRHIDEPRRMQTRLALRFIPRLPVMLKRARSHKRIKVRRHRSTHGHGVQLR